MTKKDLEERGWIFSYEFDNILHFDKGDTWKDDGNGAFLYFDTKINNITIITTDKGFNMDGPVSSPKFNGTCENIDTFDFICKLIRLKI